MGEYKQQGGGSSFGGNSNRSRFGRPGDREFRKTQMFNATCAECGKPCEVPFRPNGEKPVYCNYCFGKNKANAGYPPVAAKPQFGSAKPFNNGPRFDNTPKVDNAQMNELKRQLELVNSKLDRLTDMLKKGSEPMVEKKVGVIVASAAKPAEPMA